jgi:hypothetical protein
LRDTYDNVAFTYFPLSSPLQGVAWLELMLCLCVSGKKDVGDEIEDEEQLLGLKGEQQHENKSEMQEEKDGGVEMQVRAHTHTHTHTRTHAHARTHTWKRPSIWSLSRVMCVSTSLLKSIS